MSFFVVGVSHRSAPVEVLDRIALSPEAGQSVAREVVRSTDVAEAMVVSTCNRVEVYADVARFHGALDDVTDALAKATAMTREELTSHLYVHYEDRAVSHLFEVTAGLDSMVVGEAQILGQVRAALRSAQEAATVGRVLNEVTQTALRVGKRIHSETGIDRAGASVVSVSLDHGIALLRGPDAGADLTGLRALVVGAGSMSSLAATSLAARGAQVVIANRTPERAVALAETGGGEAITMDRLVEGIAGADVIVSCTGASGVVIRHDHVVAAHGDGRSRVFVDLALPHDTEPSISELPGVDRVDLTVVGDLPGAAASVADVARAREVLADELAGYLAAVASSRVDPVVVSLRARADEVIAAELERLRLRSPAMTPDVLDEVERALRHALSTLLHAPTVRMKRLAEAPDGVRYAEALQRLFDLSPDAIAAVSTTDLSRPTT